MRIDSLTRREAVLVIVSAFSAPAIALASEETCSWYGDSFSFSSGTVRIPARYFDGSNIGLEMNCSATANGMFNVACYRGDGASVGMRKISYQGFSKVTWPSVGPGDYYFHLTKIRDGVRVSSSDVAFFSW